MVEKVISGGQTGADIAALEAARHLGIETGGFAPHGYRTSEGTNIDLKAVYKLVEMEDGGTVGMQYTKRSMRNVDCADATLAFHADGSHGTDKTIKYCNTGVWGSSTYAKWNHRPVMVIEDFYVSTTKKIHEFLEKHNVKILNVCGSRKSKRYKDWRSKIRAFLVVVLKQYNDKHAASIRQSIENKREESGDQVIVGRTIHPPGEVAIGAMGTRRSEEKEEPKQVQGDHPQEKIN